MFLLLLKKQATNNNKNVQQFCTGIWFYTKLYLCMCKWIYMYHLRYNTMQHNKSVHVCGHNQRILIHVTNLQCGFHVFFFFIYVFIQYKCLYVLLGKIVFFIYSMLLLLFNSFIHSFISIFDFYFVLYVYLL